MKPLIMNEGDPIQGVEELRLVLRSIFNTPALAPVIDGLVQTLSGRPDLLASHAALVDALRATMMDQLKATPGSAELKRVLHAILDHELATAENRTAYVPAMHANPAAVRWPNPADPDHPRSIHAELPWAREHKIVDRSTPIGSAGSCFAVEIAHRLRADGYNYVVTEENPDSCAAWGPIFNVPAFRQLVERAFGRRTLPRLLWTHEGGLRDPFREEIAFASVEEYEAGYDAHLAATRAALEQVEVFVMTLGLNEVWTLRADGSVFARNPWKVAAALVERKVLTVEENVQELQRMLDVWRAHNPGLKLILTVSPIPMLATFRGHDTHVVAATGHAKATLRVAAEEFARRNRDVHYFPAFETVMYCTERPWEPDQRHVTRAAVAKVMRLFDRTFVHEETVKLDTRRRARFLLELDPRAPERALESTLATWVTTFRPEDDACLVTWLSGSGNSALDETERAAGQIIEAAGVALDRIPEVLMLEGRRAQRDALLRQGATVIAPGAGDAVDAARELGLPVVQPTGPALRAAYEDAIERDRFEQMLPMLRRVCEAAAAPHPQRSAVGGLLDTFAVGYRHFLVTGKTPGPAYLAMRHLFALTNGHFNDALLALYQTVHPPYALPSARGVLGDLDAAAIAAIVRDVTDTGVHVLPGHVSGEICDRLTRWALATPTLPQSPPAASPDPVLYDPDRPASVHQRFTDDDLIANPDVRAFATDLSFLSVAQAFLGCKPILSHAGMWWSTTFLKHADSYAAQLYHSDMDKPNFIQFFLYVTDVTPETGPHCFARGSHRGKPLALRRDGRVPDEEMAQHYAPGDLLELTGRRGTIIVANSRGLHKGKALIRGQRLLMNLIFSSSLFGASHATVRLDHRTDADFRQMVATHPRLYSRMIA